MTNEQVLAGVVRAWANQELPSEPDEADRAASLAAASYAESIDLGMITIDDLLIDLAADLTDLSRRSRFVAHRDTPARRPGRGVGRPGFHGDLGVRKPSADHGASALSRPDGQALARGFPLRSWARMPSY